MRTIIAGTREETRYSEVEKAMEECGWTPTIVLSGGARGVDKLGEAWAQAHDLAVVRFPADWKKYKQAAGPIRNREMAENADAVVAVWDGSSPGTFNMIRQARAMGLKVHVHYTTARKTFTLRSKE